MQWKTHRLQKQWFKKIIDEVDLLLLDEGVNPLIISRQLKGKSFIYPVEYQLATKLVNSLKEKEDYKVDQKEKDIWLTKKGIKKCQDFYQVNNLFAFEMKRSLTPPNNWGLDLNYQSSFHLLSNSKFSLEFLIIWQNIIKHII